jgi:ABC-type transport system involved in cytochrome bd biosynthesis fused ATPase/permease subunit
MVQHLAAEFYLPLGRLEQKFHDHFFSKDYELDLVDLATLRQGKDESVNSPSIPKPSSPNHSC